MSGGSPGRVGGLGKPVDTTAFYRILEVEKGASESEIRKAHRKLALKHHPDKGGDPEKFKEITRVYSVLNDPQKRRIYDEYGEEGLEGHGVPFGPRPDKHPKTKDLVHPLNVTLEQLYNGATKKMAITRKVVDKKTGVKECSDCDGRGVKVEVIRIASMIQQMQSHCPACGGTGKRFTTKSEREVLEVHVQKGSPDNHQERFREMADEHPGADPGDVVFVLEEQEHAEFRRKGADLFVERKISLVEALCGFDMELTHLDGRKLLIKTSPGEIVKPMAQGFNPMAKEEAKLDWESVEDCDCPSIDTVAQASTTDVEALKQACETQLKRKGIDVGAFVVDGGKAFFKQCTREEALAATNTKKGSTMYIVSDPDAKKAFRMMKAVKGEGMPTFKNPFVHGNLFLNLTIEFPDKLTSDAQSQLQGLLPPPLNAPTWKEDEQSVEIHFVTDIDPVQSYQSNKANMSGSGEAYEEEEGEWGHSGGPGVQCHQQ